MYSDYNSITKVNKYEAKAEHLNKIVLIRKLYWVLIWK